MKLTLAEVVKREVVLKNHVPIALGSIEGDKTLCVIVKKSDDSDVSFLIRFPDTKARNRLTLTDTFTDATQADYSDLLVECVHQAAQDDSSGFTFNYKLESGNGTYHGLKPLPEKERAAVEQRIRAMRRFYLAKEYLTQELKEASLVGVAWRLKFRHPLPDPSDEDSPMHYSFCRKEEQETGPYIASIVGNRLLVNEDKYLKLFTEICRVLNQEYGIVKINVMKNPDAHVAK